MHARTPGGQSDEARFNVAHDIRAHFYPVEETSTGPGTVHPKDLKIPELDRIFHQARTLVITGNLPGMEFVESFETKLRLTEYDGMEYPEDGNRAHLFAKRWHHFLTTSGDGYTMRIAVRKEGARFNNKLWPAFEFVYGGHDRNPDVEARVTGLYYSIRPEFEVVENGMLMLPGEKEIPLYSIPGAGSPAASVVIELGEEWVV